MSYMTMTIKRFLYLYFSNTFGNSIRDKRSLSLLFLLRIKFSFIQKKIISVPFNIDSTHDQVLS